MSGQKDGEKALGSVPAAWASDSSRDLQDRDEVVSSADAGSMQHFGEDLASASTPVFVSCDL